MSGYGMRLHAGRTWVELPTNLPRRTVVLIHGVDEPGKLWMNAAPALAADGIACVAFTYPNDQPIRASAAFLLVSLEKLRRHGVEEVAVVAHSMGGLVTREMLTSPDLGHAAGVAAGALPRVARLIMLGTPNHGSPLAGLRVLAEFRDQWVRFLRGDGELLGAWADGTGEAGDDLKPGSAFLRDLNARPMPTDTHVTSIAGIASPLTQEELSTAAAAWRQALPEDRGAWISELAGRLESAVDRIGDGVVALESTRLPGVTDEVVVNANHLSMVRNVRSDSRRIPPAIPILRDRLRDFAAAAPVPERR